MKNTMIKTFLLFSLLAPWHAIRTDVSQAGVSQHDDDIDNDTDVDNNNDDDTAETQLRKRKKVKKFCSVCAKCLSVSGDLTDNGILTANGPLIVNDGATITGPVTINGVSVGLTPTYGYVYDMSLQLVAPNSPVTFNSNGPLSGITHTLGSSIITVANAGVYTILWSATDLYVDETLCEIYVNGMPAPSTAYLSLFEAIGLAILPLNAGDQIQLITKDFVYTALDVVDAAVLIQRIG